MSSKRIKLVRLSGFGHLEFLHLNNACLDRHSLLDLGQLRSLGLFYCDLDRFDSRCLYTCARLQSFSCGLSRRFNPSWHRFDFKRLALLEHLHLDAVRLPSKQVEFMRTLDTSESLACLELFCNLNSNTIESIFTGLTLGNLQVLNLSGNRIGSLTRDLFSNLTSLRKLVAFNSQIECIDFGAVNRLEKLEYLNLVRNVIRTLRNGMFASLKSLRTLNLKANKIESIEPDAFVGLDEVEEINLMKNAIISVDMSTVAGLKKLKRVAVGGSLVM